MDSPIRLSIVLVRGIETGRETVRLTVISYTFKMYLVLTLFPLFMGEAELQRCWEDIMPTAYSMNVGYYESVQFQCDKHLMPYVCMYVRMCTTRACV